MALWYNSLTSIVQTQTAELVGARLMPERIAYITLSDLPILSIDKFKNINLLEESQSPDYFELVKIITLKDIGSALIRAAYADAIIFLPSFESSYAKVLLSNYDSSAGMIRKFDYLAEGILALETKRKFYRTHDHGV